VCSREERVGEGCEKKVGREGEKRGWEEKVLGKERDERVGEKVGLRRRWKERRGWAEREWNVSGWECSG
jgi:hypothetical protein